MDKKLWQIKSFIIENIPKWICPTCNVGLLLHTKNQLLEETSDSKKNGQEESTYHFSFSLKCNNPDCEEIVICTGYAHDDVIVDEDFDPKHDEFGGSLEIVYTPYYFYPNLNLIKILDNLPQDLKYMLESSFSLFFTDYSSCANKIRLFLEHLLNYLKVKKGKGKNKLKLGQRINELQKHPKFKNIFNLINAIRWIGNEGSHDDSLKRNDVLIAYELLEKIFEEIFEKRTINLDKKAQAINKRKK
jgi:hypothetical protein